MPTDYENSTQKSGSVAQQPCHEEVCKKFPPSREVGRCTYYKQRNINFIQRHQYDSKSGGDNPPKYYLNYGYKYCNKFNLETMPKLSQEGKKWLLNTLRRLQFFMEQGVVNASWKAKINIKFNEEYLNNNPKKFYEGIECRDEDFTQFAFATHPDAYNPKMFKKLTCEDLSIIGLTPSDEYKLKANHKIDTLIQVFYVGKELWKIGDISTIVGNCAEETGSYIGKKIDEAVDKIEDIFETFADRVSRGGI